jgi:hypothetical protein
MREEALINYLAELQRHEGKHGEFRDRIHRVCDEIEKELGIEKQSIGDVKVNIDFSEISKRIQNDIKKLTRQTTANTIQSVTHSKLS